MEKKLYTAKIIQTDFFGDKTITTSTCYSDKDAKDRVLDICKRNGWRSPRWWEFWRRDDTKETDLKLKPTK